MRLVRARGTNPSPAGPAGGGRNRVRNLETNVCETERREPVPRPRIPTRRRLGRLRVPIAGPYRPWARLFVDADGRIRATVRLWEIDRAVSRTIDLDVLRGYARASRLGPLEAGLDAIARRARRRRAP